jgi:hypothetical protein
MKSIAMRVSTALLCSLVLWGLSRCGYGIGTISFFVLLAIFAFGSELPAKRLAKRPLINLVVSFVYASIFFSAVSVLRAVVDAGFPQSICIDSDGLTCFWLIMFLCLMNSAVHVDRLEKRKAGILLLGTCAAISLYLFLRGISLPYP